MKIFTTTQEASEHAHATTARKVLVPTMGALHRGHLELVRLARANAGADGVVAVSIFVNPMQFAPGGDYDKYPRPESADAELCERAGVDVLFRPTPDQMYAADRSVAVEENALSETLCGKSRPGHFRGVCTVVAKLFNLLAPHAAVFGEKDFQQLAIIRRMVRDLNFAIEIIAAPTVREPDGLACSSRNQYLSAEERAEAVVLRQACLAAKHALENGETSAARLKEIAAEPIAGAPRARVDYLEIVDADTLQPAADARKNAVLALAFFFGSTRLIDNIRLS